MQKDQRLNIATQTKTKIAKVFLVFNLFNKSQQPVSYKNINP